MSEKKYKTFVDYYKEDDEFRKKHLDYMKEQVECECGMKIGRGNMTRHKKGHLHLDKIEKVRRIKELRQELKKLKKELYGE